MYRFARCQGVLKPRFLALCAHQRACSTPEPTQGRWNKMCSKSCTCHKNHALALVPPLCEDVLLPQPFLPQQQQSQTLTATALRLGFWAPMEQDLCSARTSYKTITYKIFGDFSKILFQHKCLNLKGKFIFEVQEPLYIFLPVLLYIYILNILQYSNIYPILLHFMFLLLYNLLLLLTFYKNNKKEVLFHSFVSN